METPRRGESGHFFSNFDKRGFFWSRSNRTFWRRRRCRPGPFFVFFCFSSLLCGVRRERASLGARRRELRGPSGLQAQGSTFCSAGSSASEPDERIFTFLERESKRERRERERERKKLTFFPSLPKKQRRRRLRQDLHHRHHGPLLPRGLRRRVPRGLLLPGRALLRHAARAAGPG